MPEVATVLGSIPASPSDTVKSEGAADEAVLNELQREKKPKKFPFSKYAQNFSRFSQNRKKVLDTNILWKLIFFLVTEQVRNIKMLQSFLDSG
jgi:hypothetical protein